MSEPKETIFHLLRPKEFRTWCIGYKPPSPAMNTTTRVSKCNCVNCLTKYRAVIGRPKQFRKAWTNRAVWSEKTPALEE